MSKKVYVIEDHPPHREAIVSLLRSVGFDVTEAQDHLEARDRLASGYRPDIITSDYHTSFSDQENIDGESFVKQGMHQGVPVIALSGVPRFNERIKHANPDQVIGCISRDLIIRYAKVLSGEFKSKIEQSQLDAGENYLPAMEKLRINAVNEWEQLFDLITNLRSTYQSPSETALPRSNHPAR